MKTAWPKPLMVAGAVVALLALGACSPGDDEHVVMPSGTTAPRDDTSATASAPVTKVTQSGVNEAPALKDGATSIILDVRQAKCEAGPGKASATGTVTNNANEARDLVITVSWNTPDNSKTFTQASAVLKQVPAGESRGYEIHTTVEAPKDSATVCTLSAMSGTLK